MSLFFDYTLNGIANGMIYAALALALVLIYRATRIINFAQGAAGMLTTFIAFSLLARASATGWPSSWCSSSALPSGRRPSAHRFQNPRSQIRHRHTAGVPFVLDRYLRRAGEDLSLRRGAPMFVPGSRGSPVRGSGVCRPFATAQKILAAGRNGCLSGPHLTFRLSRHAQARGRTASTKTPKVSLRNWPHRARRMTRCGSTMMQ